MKVNFAMELAVFSMLESVGKDWKLPWGNVAEIVGAGCLAGIDGRDRPEFLRERLDRMVREQGWMCPISLRGEGWDYDSYYSITRDEIVMPDRERYASCYEENDFYSELLHNMAHSTGSEKRLGRIIPGQFGSSMYSTEELVSELSAAAVCQVFGLEKRVKSDSLAYLNAWTWSWRDEPGYPAMVLGMVKECVDMMLEKIISGAE